MVMMDPTRGADPRNVLPNFFALQLKWDAPLNIDMDLFKFQIELLALDVNQGGAWADQAMVHPYIDFAPALPAA